MSDTQSILHWKQKYILRYTKNYQSMRRKLIITIHSEICDIGNNFILNYYKEIIIKIYSKEVYIENLYIF